MSYKSNSNIFLWMRSPVFEIGPQLTAFAASFLKMRGLWKKVAALLQPFRIKSLYDEFLDQINFNYFSIFVWLLDYNLKVSKLTHLSKSSFNKLSKSCIFFLLVVLLRTIRAYILYFHLIIIVIFESWLFRWLNGLSASPKEGKKIIFTKFMQSFFVFLLVWKC